MTNIEMFDVYREKKKDKVLVVIKQKEKEPISFLVQGIWPPKPQGKFLRDAKGNIIYGADGIPRREGDGKGAVKREINGKNKTNRNGTNTTNPTGTRPSGSTQNGGKRDKNGNITYGAGGQSLNRGNSNNQGTPQEGEQPRVR